uniref:MARVEL domain-containing protein n=1 Tax=Trichuris muris TaxID=70415 RepID=A0A5S6Q3E6_TRIMR
MHGSENGTDDASHKRGLRPIPRRFTGISMLNAFAPAYPTAERSQTTLGRRTSAASEMSPLRNKNKGKALGSDNSAAIEWGKSEYKYTPFKRGPRIVHTEGEWNEKGGERVEGYDKPNGDDSEKRSEKVSHGRSEMDDGRTTSGRGTPNSLAAAWRNSHTLHRSTADITADSGIQSYQQVAVKPQSAQISPSSVKRLPLSLPHMPPAYAPFMMYNPANVQSRPWSTCGFPPPWPADLPCNGHAESNEIVATKRAAETDTKEPCTNAKSFWRPLRMIAILQLVLGVAILITGVIRVILGAHMAVGFDILVGLLVIIVQGTILAAMAKSNWCLMAAGYTASVVQCSSLGLPIFASLQSLQNADANTAAHQYVVDIFIVALCLSDLVVVAISLSYTCYAVTRKFRICEKDAQQTINCHSNSTLNELSQSPELSRKDQDPSKDAK